MIRTGTYRVYGLLGYGIMSGRWLQSFLKNLLLPPSPR